MAYRQNSSGGNGSNNMAIPPPVPRTNSNNSFSSEPQQQSQMQPQANTNNRPNIESTQHLNQNQRQTNDERLFIIAKDVDELPHVKKKIAELVSSFYLGPWLSWTDVPSEIKTKIWDAFKGKYKWDQESQHQIRKRLNSIASTWLKKHLFNARKDDKQPEDIGDNVWQQLKIKWSEGSYKMKCQKAKANRAANSGSEVSQYRGGSRSVSEHKRKMAIKMGHNPSLKEVYTVCWGQNNVLVAEKPKQIMDEYEKNLAKASQCDDGVINEEQVWFETVGCKKGRVYGLGNLAPSLVSSCSGLESMSQSNINISQQNIIAQQSEKINSQGEMIQSMKSELATTNQELATTNQKLEAITSALLKQGIQLSPTSEDHRHTIGTVESEVGSFMVSRS